MPPYVFTFMSAEKGLVQVVQRHYTFVLLGVTDWWLFGADD